MVIKYKQDKLYHLPRLPFVSLTHQTDHLVVGLIRFSDRALLRIFYLIVYVEIAEAVCLILIRQKTA